MELKDKSVGELIELVKKRELKVYDMVKYYLQRIEKYDGEINAFISINEDALSQAEELDRKLLREGKLGALWGVPIAIKDNIAVKGMRNTCGSKILRNYKAPYDGEVIELIKEEDGIIIGKTNMDEFGMGCTSENSAFGKVLNPLDKSCSPGGSSGGSAAAVSAGFAPIALGSDTGGSVRQPAAFCGLYGYKPTYGGISRYGLTTFASTLDTIGIISRTLQDGEDLMRIISKRGKYDSTYVKMQEEELEEEEIRIGYIKECFPKDRGRDGTFKESMDGYLESLKEGNFSVEEFSIEGIKEMLWCYYLLSSSEAATTLSRFDGITFGERVDMPEAGFKELIKKNRSAGLGAEVKKRIMVGNYIISEGHMDDYYRKACVLREEISKKFEKIFESVDVIFIPTTPGGAFNYREIQDEKKEFIYKGDVFTVPVSLGGLPAVSVPLGKVNDEVFSGQFICGRGEDYKLFSLVKRIEKAAGGDSHV